MNSTPEPCLLGDGHRRDEFDPTQYLVSRKKKQTLEASERLDRATPKPLLSKGGVVCGKVDEGRRSEPRRKVVERDADGRIVAIMGEVIDDNSTD